MKNSHLKIKPEDCSAIGLLVFDYMEKHQLALTSMAKKVGISRAVLRIACYKQGSPSRRTLLKLATVLNKSERELLRLDAENKLALIYETNDW